MPRCGDATHCLRQRSNSSVHGNEARCASLAATRKSERCDTQPLSCALQCIELWAALTGGGALCARTTCDVATPNSACWIRAQQRCPW